MKQLSIRKMYVKHDTYSYQNDIHFIRNQHTHTYTIEPVDQTHHTFSCDVGFTKNFQGF